MPWDERLQEAAYTSPSGKRLVFLYENVRSEVTKKTTAYDFPDADGTFIQDLGHSGRRYPLRIIISGIDYDLIAQEWESVFDEVGTGKLEHPIYGTKNVVPFGEIARRDDLKTSGNQCIFEVTFFETIVEIFPTTELTPSDDILQGIDNWSDAAAEEFALTVELDTAVERVSLKEQFNKAVGAVSDTMEKIVATKEAVERQFNEVVDSVQSSIDFLIGVPLTLAFQTSVLLQAPARAAALIGARLDAYVNLTNQIIQGTFQGVGDTGPLIPTTLSTQAVNTFRSMDLFVQGLVTGSVIAVINNEFETKPQALAAAEVIIDQLESVIVWRDNNLTNLELVDDGSAYQQLQESVAMVVGFLVEISFTLKPERILFTDRARTIIDLVAELYGEVDVNLDFFINSNNLSGSEILEIPSGRRIVYYV